MPEAAPQVVDSSWVRFRAAAYLSGRGVSFGCGNDPIVPHQALDGDKYSLNADIFKYPQVDICGLDFSILAKDSLDHVFIGPRDNPPIKELVSKLKIGGHLILYVIHADQEAIRKHLPDLGQWQEKDTYIRVGNQFLGVWKLLGRSKHGILAPKPKGAKRACIARYGAIGDMIMITPLIKRLAQDGYEVTMNVTPYCADVLAGNPYVSNIIRQERDMIPNQDLGPYWNEWMPDYDKYINLSESIEGKLLKVEGRADFYTTKAWRDKICDVNYYDNTMRLGGYPDVVGQNGELYFTNSEEKEARHMREKFKDRFLIMWALKGSSHHKIYPILGPVLTHWLDRHPDAVTMLVGSEADKPLQFEHPQVVPLAGRTHIRDVFCLAKYVDLVAGPETSITNSAGCFDTPVLTMLTHSTHENLCKYWKNDYCLQADVACTGCHQLHYSPESCPCVDLREQGREEPAWSGPICAAVGFTPERVWARLDEVYNHWKAK